MSKSSLKDNQEGIISLVVTMIIIMVTTLIMLGFARLMRRESQQALDRQLSTQAYYAAESAINDVSKNISFSATPTTTCAAGPKATLASSNVSYTCVLVDSALATLEYPLELERSLVVPVSAAGGATLDSLTVSWGNFNPATDGFANNPPTTDGFSPATPAGSWAPGTGVVRFDLVPVPPAGTPINRNTLINQTQSFILYPSRAGAATVAYNPSHSSKGQVVGKCDPTRPAQPCSVTITSLGGLTGYTYFVRMRSSYVAAKAIVTGTSSGTSVELNGQISIDATGKAGDVLRRVQVRRAIGNFYGYPEFALESADSLCKTLEVTSPAPAGPGNPTIITLDPAFECQVPFAAP
jgi:hypothetical protein